MGLQLLSALLLATALRAGEPCETKLDIRVHWVDSTQELQSARGAVKERVRDIFETASVRLLWIDSRTEIGSDALAVILLRDPPPAPYVPAHALGVVADGENRRFAYVYVNQLLKGVGLAGPVRSLTTEEVVAFSRALSRVIAHEIVHSLLPGEAHTDSGIMQEHLTPTLLQRAELALDGGTRCRIRQALGAKARCERAAR